MFKIEEVKKINFTFDQADKSNIISFYNQEIAVLTRIMLYHPLIVFNCTGPRNRISLKKKTTTLLPITGYLKFAWESMYFHLKD